MKFLSLREVTSFRSMSDVYDWMVWGKRKDWMICRYIHIYIYIYLRKRSIEGYFLVIAIFTAIRPQ